MRCEEQCAPIWSLGLTLMTMIVSSTDINYDEQWKDDDVEYECPFMANLMSFDILS